MEKIVERFENEGLMIFNVIEDIFECPPLQKTSHTSIRKLFEQISNNLLSFKFLGEDMEKWDSVITYKFVSKFDSMTRKD